MLIVALISAALSTTAPATKPSSGDSAIVVTAERIQAQKSALADCIARNCPANQDIDATLALAESQLMEGKYHDARKTLLASLGRNKDEAARYPIPLSDLYRANGRVAADLGLDADYYRSTWAIYRTLKYGLPSDEVRQLSAMMEVAEMIYRTRGHPFARIYYERIARRARAAGRPDIAALAELRSAIRHLPPGSVWQVKEVKRIASLQGTDLRAAALEGKLALARIAYAKGREPEAEAIKNDLAALNIKRPILIYSPPYDMITRDMPRGSEIENPQSRQVVVTIETRNENETGGGGRQGGITARPASSMEQRGPATFAMRRETPVVEDMWMDVAFRVTPEGRVADMKVTRSRGDTFWARPLLASIQGRRYTPGDPSSPTSRRLERYTYTSGYERKTDTRSAGHSPDTRIEYMDLSDEAGGLTVAD